MLFCFSVCVEPVSAEDKHCVLFVPARACTRGISRSLITLSLSLTPVPNPPSVFSLFASLALCPARAIYGSTLKRIGEWSRRLCKCCNRWNSCGVMDVSAQTWGLHEHHCMCAPLIPARVFRLPRDISVNTHITHIPSVAYMCAAWLPWMPTSKCFSVDHQASILPVLAVFPRDDVCFKTLFFPSSSGLF